MWAFSGLGLGQGLSPKHFSRYEFGPLIFVAFIQYAEGRVSFQDWHIFSCEHSPRLGLGLGAGAEPETSLYRFGPLIFAAFI